MDEKRKKYWEEQDAKRKERRQQEDIDSIRQDAGNEIDNLKENIQNLDEKIWDYYELHSGSIIELRIEIDSLKDEIKKLNEFKEIIKSRKTGKMKLKLIEVYEKIFGSDTYNSDF